MSFGLHKSFGRICREQFNLDKMYRPIDDQIVVAEKECRGDKFTYTEIVFKSGRKMMGLCLNHFETNTIPFEYKNSTIIVGR